MTHARDIAWASRDAAFAQVRAAVAAGQPFEVIVLDGEPAPVPTQVRDLATAAGGARVVLIASGVEGIAPANRVGAAEVVSRPFNAPELIFRICRGGETPVVAPCG